MNNISIRLWNSHLPPLINHEDIVASQRYRFGSLVFIYFECSGMEIFVSEILAFPYSL